ncbi:MAG: hypothetical protein FWE11_06590 [Defluviitaleaceae bacterium]|nr:hypothetical protein [Defluviitaleaceae bacterium]
MKIIAIKCPGCAAPVNVDLDTSTRGVCDYCKAAFYIKPESNDQGYQVRTEPRTMPKQNAEMSPPPPPRHVAQHKQITFNKTATNVTGIAFVRKSFAMIVLLFCIGVFITLVFFAFRILFNTFGGTSNSSAPPPVIYVPPATLTPIPTIMPSPTPQLETSQPTETPQSTEPPQPAETPIPEEPEASPEESSHFYSINQTLEFPPFLVTITEVLVHETWILGPSEGYKYIGIVFEFENMTNEAQSLSNRTSVFVDDFYYSSSNNATVVISADLGISMLSQSSTLSGGRRMRGQRGFEIPIGTEEIEMELSVGTSSRDSVTRLFRIVLPVE